MTVRRREFMALLGSAMTAWPVAALAQPAGKVFRVGFIAATVPVSEMVGPEPANPVIRAFVQGLRALGYVEGQPRPGAAVGRGQVRAFW